MLKKALILFFIIVAATPLSVWLLWGPSTDHNAGGLSVDFPSPYGGALLKTDYYRALDQYINEQIVFGDRLRRMKNWIDFKFFGRTDRTDIHVGRQGWLFRRIDIENHIQDQCADAGAAHRLLLDLQAVEKVVTASGRRFRFLVVPSKASVYPEYIGWVPLPAGGRCSAYDLLREAHHLHPLESWIPLESAIMANKFGSYLVYDATAGFLNGRGAAVAAETLHQSFFKINTLAPVMAVANRYDDLERQLLGQAVAVPKNTLRQLAGGRTDGIGSTLVYGDTAVESLLPHLAQISQSLEIVSAETVPSRQVGEDWRIFDSILLQATESGIRHLQIDLDRIYDQLAGEADRVTRTPVNLDAVRSIAHTALNPMAGGVEIKSVGSRSSFALIDLPGSYQRCFRVLRINFSAIQPDKMTVEYRTRPPIRTVKPVPAGRFNLYLPLPVKSSLSMRFQPGGQAGLLMLHDAEIIGFTAAEDDACGRRHQDREIIVAASSPSASPGRPQTAPTVIGPQGPVIPVAPGGRPASQPLARPKDNPPPVGNIEKVTAAGRGTGEGGHSTAREAAAATALPNQDSSPPQTVSLPTGAPPTVEGPVIDLNDFADGRIFQRQNRSADIIVSGGYAGKPAAVEARVVYYDRDEEVVPWTVIDAAPRNGIFLGLLPQVPEGGWYALEVRSQNRPHSSVKGQHRWGVGLLVACIGQSNMKEWFNTGTDLEAHDLLRVYNGQGWQKLGRRGNGAIAFGNRIVARTGIPVGLLEYAVNGSGLHPKADWGTGYWEDARAGSIYRRFVTHVAATGGRLEFVVWIQGEADAARGTVTGAEYQTALTRFIQRQVRKDIINGSTRPQLPFLVVGMVKRPGGHDAPHQDLREAQAAVTDQLAECYLAATTLDLKNQGKQHLAPGAYVIMGQRVAQTILFVLGLENFHRGPRVVGVRTVGREVLEIALQHRGGNDIRPASGITGWEVVDTEGTVPIRNVVRQNSETLRIDLERPLADAVEVRYLHGARPDARRPLMDNANPNLPLEAFRGGLDSQPLLPARSPSGTASP